MTRSPTRLPIALGERSYDILIGPDLVDSVDAFEGLPRGHGAVIVTNTTVAQLLADRLARTLAGRYERVSTVALPDGEEHKSWASMNLVFDHLLANAFDRRTTLYALGGGVVGDMTGFAAASYMRGIDYVQVPTTLLAQVDSSVGGKTAINHPLGKNMIGAFHQPIRVVADTSTLATLPQRELVAGLAEVIKYGPIADDAFLDWIDVNLGLLLKKDAAAISHAIQRSCEIKAQVVSQDERETGLRAILNFGHTFGHAIEAGLGFGDWLHGEAVGCGMVMAADLSGRLGLVSRDRVAHLTSLIERAGLPVTAPPLGAQRYLELMRLDKKADGGAIRFVVLDGPGRASLRAVPDDLVMQVIAAHCR